MNTELHEASRPAFEAAHKGFNHTRLGDGRYYGGIEQVHWEAWCRALDLAAEQAAKDSAPVASPIAKTPPLSASGVGTGGDTCSACGGTGEVIHFGESFSSCPRKIPCWKCHRSQPAQETAQAGSAVEWVKARAYNYGIGLPEKDALELAERCDHAENQCNHYWLTARGYSLELKDLRSQLAQAQAEREVLRGALEEIVGYGNSGICPYGCDTPSIARAALAKPDGKEGEG